jgi:Gluconate 2-dehydrogenase subunit 3
MKRRTLLKWAAVMVGGTVAGAGAVRHVLRRPEPYSALAQWKGFNGADLELMNALANTIIPPTDSPGAGDAGVASVIADVVTVCFPDDHKASFIGGLQALEQSCTDRFGKSFVKLTPENQSEIVRKLDREQRLVARAQEVFRRVNGAFGEKIGSAIGAVAGESGVPHYFGQLKELAVIAYCKSEAGATQALRYDPVPGRYNGALPYKTGDKTWAT